MENYSTQLYETLEKACGKCKSDTISLSGGLDSTVIAYFLRKYKPNSISVISKEHAASDLAYCQMAAKKFDLPLTILEADTPEILEALDQTIMILKNFNDIEIRNNVVMYLALKWAKENNHNSMITGDGADELFAGYSFLINKTEEELESEIRRIFSIMHFPTKKIGESIGVRVESPFLDTNVIELSLRIPANLKVDTHEDKKYGKWILRKTFEDKIPKKIAWRQKAPMQDGAGTGYLVDLFNNLISDNDFVQKKEKIEKDSGILLRTKESMHYFEIYQKYFGLPKIAKDQSDSCPYCKSDTKNSKFCRMCGAFPI